MKKLSKSQRTLVVIGLSIPILSVLALSLIRANTEEQQLQVLRETIEPNLATKRPYTEPESLPPQPEQCTLVHINHLGRHGSRYPGSPEVAQKDYLQPSKNLGLLDNNDTVRLTEYGQQLQAILQQQQALYLSETGTPAGEITPQGERELAGIAARMISSSGYSKEQFLELLKQRSGTASTTTVHRTQTSREAFLESWQKELGSNALNLTLATPPPDFPDTTLQFYQVCGNLAQNWKKSVNDNRDKITAASNDPNNAEDLRNFADFFIEGLSLKEARDFGKLAYNWCVLDANQDYQLQLCSLFTKAPDYQSIFEIYGEAASLSHFYGRGPAPALKSLNRDSAIELLNDFLAGSGKLDTRPETPFVNLRFAHESTILRFEQILGLVTYSNSTDTENNVTWDVSELSPMSANIVWQTFQCEQPNQAAPIAKVRMLVNEQITPFPIAACDNENGLCNWSSVEDHYRKRYKDVTLASVCGKVSTEFSDGSHIHQ